MNYTIDEKNLERQRLLARAIEPFTRRMLDALGLKSESRCLDVACGLGETTRLIASYLGTRGECVGIDQDPALIEAARAGSSGGAPVAFRVADATQLPFEDQSFDFVFARYLLVHVKEPASVLREMVRVARKGAVVAAQEPDMVSQYTYPECWAYTRLGDIFSALFPDARIGRKLVTLFREVGCRPVGSLGDLGVEAGGTTYKRLYRLTVEAVIPALLRAGFSTEAELRSLHREMERVENDEAILCIGHPLIAVWGIT